MNDPLNGSTQIDLLFTVTVSNDPFADQLLLTDQGRAIEQGTNNAFLDGEDIVRSCCRSPTSTSRRAQGTYSFVETQPAGYLDGAEEDADPTGPPAVTIINDRFDNVVLNPFPVRGPFNFGEIAANGVIAGSVYVDLNNNAVREGNEVGIAGTVINRRGTDLAGNAVALTTVTDAAGNYAFTALLPGTYTVIESHPVAYLDGLDSAGTAGGIAGNGTIASIVLGPNQISTLNNFGELGLRSGIITKRWFLASTRR